MDSDFLQQLQQLQPAAAELAWPFAIALAWIIAELGHRWTRMPRISLYGIVGFLLGPAQAGSRFQIRYEPGTV